MKYNLLILFTLITTMTLAQKATLKEAFLEKWKNSKTYLLDIAAAMPEEKYGYKPTEREMDFRNQLLHIRANMLWLGTTHFSDQKFDRNSLKENLPNSKKDVIDALTHSFDYVYQQIKKTEPADFSTTVDFFAGKKTKLQILNLLQDHVTHHRGQLIVYLNLNEIKPPQYVGW